MLESWFIYIFPAVSLHRYWITHCSDDSHDIFRTLLFSCQVAAYTWSAQYYVGKIIWIVVPSGRWADQEDIVKPRQGKHIPFRGVYRQDSPIIQTSCNFIICIWKRPEQSDWPKLGTSAPVTVGVPLRPCASSSFFFCPRMINTPDFMVRPSYDHHRPCLFARYIEKGSTNSIAKAVLYIQSVSDHELSSEFTCSGKGSTETINKTVTLVRRGQLRVTRC